MRPSRAGRMPQSFLRKPRRAGAEAPQPPLRGGLRYAKRLVVFDDLHPSGAAPLSAPKGASAFGEGSVLRGVISERWCFN